MWVKSSKVCLVCSDVTSGSLWPPQGHPSCPSMDRCRPAGAWTTDGQILTDRATVTCRGPRGRPTPRNGMRMPVCHELRRAPGPCARRPTSVHLAETPCSAARRERGHSSRCHALPRATAPRGRAPSARPRRSQAVRCMPAQLLRHPCRGRRPRSRTPGGAEGAVDPTSPAATAMPLR